MGKHELKYSDLILAHQDTHVITYKGKNPVLPIWNNCETIVRKTLEINSSKFFLIYFNWDNNDGAFKAEWRAHMEGDRWTKPWFVIRVWGWQNLTPDKDGWIKIKTWGELETKYYYSNSIQKSLWWTYSYMFYDKQRRKMLEEARERYFRLQEEFRKLYGISTVPAESAPHT